MSHAVVMDDAADCLDGSDEQSGVGMCRVTDLLTHKTHNGTLSECGECERENCSCGVHFYTCPLGGCVPWHQVCDGQRNCRQGGDEEECYTTTDALLRSNVRQEEIAPSQFVCATSGAVIDVTRRGDSLPDCPVYSNVPYLNKTSSSPTLPFVYRVEDEVVVDSVLSQPSHCNHTQLPCKYARPITCFPFTKLCVYDMDHYGRLQFCMNGGHLTNCQAFQCSGLYKCPKSYCISLGRVCDGHKDCPQGEEEVGCPENPRLCPGLLRCKGGGCVSPVHICDGYEDCQVLGEDEINCQLSPCPIGCNCLGASVVCALLYLSVLDVQEFKHIKISARLPEIPPITNGEDIVQMDLSHNRLLSIDPDVFLNTSYILTLNLNSNIINRLAGNTFDSLAYLRYLFLAGNKLKKIDKNVFRNIHMVDLSRSVFVSELIIAVPRAKTLLLSQNTIVDLHIDFEQSPNLQHIDLSDTVLSNINVTGEPRKGFQVEVKWNFLCCLIPGHDCNSTLELTCLCMASKDIQGAWILGIAIILLSALSVVARVLMPRMPATSALFSQNCAGVLFGLSMVLTDTKDRVDTAVAPGSTKHIGCLMSATLQYTSVGVQILMGPVSLYSLYVVTKHWTKHKEDVAKFIKRICICLWVALASIVPMVVFSLFMFSGSHLNLGHTCSVLIGSKLQSYETIPVAIFIFLFIMMTVAQITLVVEISRTIANTKRGVQNLTATGTKKSKDASILQKLVMVYLPPVIAQLPVFACCSLFVVMSEIRLAVAYPLVMFVFPLYCVWNGAYTIYEYVIYRTSK